MTRPSTHARVTDAAAMADQWGADLPALQESLW